MVALSTAIIFLCLTLIAVVIAIFTLAVSFLGRAIQESKKEQQEAARRDKVEAVARVAQLHKSIQRVQSQLKEEAVNALKKELRQYEKEKKQSEKAAKRTAPKYRRYRLLTVPGGVLPTSILLLVSFSLAAVAQLFTTAVGYAPLGASVVALLWACYRIYRSLRFVQEVAVTTEEAQFTREAEALELALDRHEEKGRPALELRFIEQEPPFTFKADTKEIIQFRVRLCRGTAAKGAEVWFYAPEGFKFPDSERTWRQGGTFSLLPNALTTKFELGTLKKGIGYPERLAVQTPSEAGRFTLLYRLHSEDSAGEHERFDIEVVE